MTRRTCRPLNFIILCVLGLGSVSVQAQAGGRGKTARTKPSVFKRIIHPRLSRAAIDKATAMKAAAKRVKETKTLIDQATAEAAGYAQERAATMADWTQRDYQGRYDRAMNAYRRGMNAWSVDIMYVGKLHNKAKAIEREANSERVKVNGRLQELDASRASALQRADGARQQLVTDQAALDAATTAHQAAMSKLYRKNTRASSEAKRSPARPSSSATLSRE